MQSAINKPNWIQYVTVVMVVVALAFAYSANSNVKNIDIPSVDYEKVAAIVVASQKDVNIPTAEEIASFVNVESADNKLLNEFLEDEFEDEYNEIENAAIDFATEELEDDSYEVIVDYIMDTFVNVDEDSIDVDVDDIEVTVTALGLKEDEDKSATVTFEIEVEYELEEGVRDTYRKDIVVTYNVVFDEGDLNDEEVSLVSIQ